MLKHAYLIIANTNFKVLRKCLELIDDSRNDVFIIIDKKAKLSDNQISQLRQVCTFSNIYLERMIVNWGGNTQVSAVLKLLKIALESGTSYQYLHFLQGSDIPIKTQDHIHDFFERNQGTEFIMIEKNRTDMAINKTQYRHFFCHNRFFRTSKIMKILNFGFVHLQKLLGIKKKLRIDVYQGSALFSITSECAAYILSREEEISKMFRWSLAADEVFAQSILMDSIFRSKIANIDQTVTSNSRLIDRSRPDGKNSPHIWRSEEFEYIINQPDEICFARKFDEKVDYKIVEQIYFHIKSGVSV